MATVKGQTAVTRSSAMVAPGFGRSGDRSAALSSNVASGALFGWNTAQNLPAVDPRPEHGGNGGGNGSRPGARRGAFGANRQTDQGNGSAGAPSAQGRSSPSPATTAAAPPTSGGRIAAAAAFLTQLLSSVTVATPSPSSAGAAQGNGDPLTRTYAARAYGRPAIPTDASFASSSGTVLPPLASGRAIDLSV